MRYATSLTLCMLSVLLLASTASAQSIQLRLSDGSRWSGEVGDRVEMRALHQGRELQLTGEIIRAGNRFLMVRAPIAGMEREFTFFDSDIRSIRTIEPVEEGVKPRAPRPAEDRPADRRDEKEPEAANTGPGVFVLPLSGGVGSRIEHSLVDKMAEHVDQYGPGQIIVLKMKTPGGLGVEMERIIERLLEVRERHRLVAWVDEAISAGCGIISVVHEIYFMTDGTAGAMTPHVGGAGIPEEALAEDIAKMGRWMEMGGRHPYFAAAMIRASFEMSYDKDSSTGEITYYNNLSGQYILVRSDENLTLTSRQAVHSGFADGIADNVDELAKLLDLPRWREISNFGQNLHDQWHRFMDRAESEIDRLRRAYQRTILNDPASELARRIQIVEDLLRWARRLPEDVALLEFGLHVPTLERELAQMRRQLAQMRR